jgi:hypothetical protein
LFVGGAVRADTVQKIHSHSVAGSVTVGAGGPTIVWIRVGETNLSPVSEINKPQTLTVRGAARWVDVLPRAAKTVLRPLQTLERGH